MKEHHEVGQIRGTGGEASENPHARYKYGMLVLPPRSNDDALEAEVLPGIHSFRTNLGDLLGTEQVRFWQASVGRFDWMELSGDVRVAIAVMPTERPSVNDGENLALIRRLEPLIDALDLVGGFKRPWGSVLVFSGRADDSKRPVSVQQMERHSPRRKPFYESREEYWGGPVDWDPDKDTWLRDWRAAAQLRDRAELRPMVAAGLKAINYALGESDLEYRLPNLVRAAEAIMGLRKGQGAQDYAARAMTFVPRIAEERLLLGLQQDGVEELLKEVYELRSECVHAKLPFKKLAERGDAGALRVAQLEFAAEVVARESLLAALQYPGPYFDSRSSLEEAWKDKVLPGALGVSMPKASISVA